MKKKEMVFKQNLWLFLTTVFLFITLAAIQSCNNDKNKEGEVKKAQNESVNNLAAAATEPFGVRNLYCYYMDTGQVNALLKGGVGNKKIIFQLSSDNLTASNPKFKVKYYLALDHNNHGEGAAEYELKDFNPALPCLTIEEGKKYTFSNNYLKLKRLSDYIGKLSSTSYYLKFTPDVDADRHIFFHFEAVDIASLKPINMQLGPLDTNPSPPAPPDN
jgi:hypothetical protein